MKHLEILLWFTQILIYNHLYFPLHVWPLLRTFPTFLQNSKGCNFRNWKLMLNYERIMEANWPQWNLRKCKIHLNHSKHSHTHTWNRIEFKLISQRSLHLIWGSLWMHLTDLHLVSRVVYASVWLWTKGSYAHFSLS